MKTRSSALYKRTENYQRGRNTGWLSGASAVTFALLPLGVLLWVLPTTGIGIA
jgi:hypothetical protein